MMLVSTEEIIRSVIDEHEITNPELQKSNFGERLELLFIVVFG